MRESLLGSFDDIYVLDLHGSKVKNETKDCPEDNNVFDIKQGVAIGIFVKRSKKPGNATVYRGDLYGSRDQKYSYLLSNDVSTTKWAKVQDTQRNTCLGKFFFFANKSFENIGEYCQWKSTKDIFIEGTSAIQTKRDELFVSFEEGTLRNTFLDINTNRLSPEILERYPLESSAGWSPKALGSFKYNENRIHPYFFRPFDQRYIYYDDDLLGRSRYRVMKHMLQPNIGIVTMRQTVDDSFRHVFVAKGLLDINLLINHHVSDQMYPLYLYTDTPQENLFKERVGSGDQNRKTNLTASFIADVSSKLKMTFVPDGKGNLVKTYGPEDVLDYMYAVFHSPTYRSRYSEFLKIAFPRLPLTSDPALFRALCDLGSKLVDLHLMQKHSPKATKYPVAGGSMVETVHYTEPGQGAAQGRVWINKSQYLEGVPPDVWEFRIGGYQVCQKWLKDRKGRQLTYDDLTHYQHVVSALAETIHLMAQIDKTIDEAGGWPIK